MSSTPWARLTTRPLPCWQEGRRGAAVVPCAVTKPGAAGRAPPPKRCVARRAARMAPPRAGNVIVEGLASALALAVPVAITTLTAEDTDKEIARLQTADGLIPLGAAVAADAVAHSIPGLSVLLSLLAEPAGAAAGVAYMMTFILSSPAVDPATLAPKGTLLAAEKADDARGAVRVPFTKIIPTALAVVDPTNSGSSGAGWKASVPGGLPKLPLNSVLIVLGVGGLILEAAAHAPVLSLFMPRVLTVAAWLAVAGWALDKRDSK